MKTKKEAIATHLQMDSAELTDYRYHAGRTSHAIYACNEAYYCATKGNEKPARFTRDYSEQLKWQKVSDTYLLNHGFTIWKATENL